MIGDRAIEGTAASASQTGRFETEWLTRPENLAAVADLTGQWIDTVHRRRPPRIVVLDMDSSESPTYGEQEGSAYNGHFSCTCYHPLFVFNQLGDLERCALRPGNVHSADGWREILEPVVSRYRSKETRLYFRGDPAFANPEIYEFLEVEGIGYAIRFPANRVLQEKIGYLLKRPVGRPPHEVRRYYASFGCQAQSWKKPRRVVAKVEWHPGELYPRVGFIVTNLARPAERVVAFYNQRGTAEQWIIEDKGAIKWTRLSCRTFAANVARLQLPGPRLQPRQLHENPGDAQARGAVVGDQPAREADQDRREGRQPRSIRHLPNGRGRGVMADIPGNPIAHPPAAGTAHSGVRGAGIRCDRRRRQRWTLMQAKERVLAPRRSQLAGSTASRAHTVRVCCCRRRPNGRFLAPQQPGIGGMSGEIPDIAGGELGT